MLMKIKKIRYNFVVAAAELKGAIDTLGEIENSDESRRAAKEHMDWLEGSIVELDKLILNLNK